MLRIRFTLLFFLLLMGVSIGAQSQDLISLNQDNYLFYAEQEEIEDYLHILKLNFIDSSAYSSIEESAVAEKNFQQFYVFVNKMTRRFGLEVTQKVFSAFDEKIKLCFSGSATIDSLTKSQLKLYAEEQFCDLLFDRYFNCATGLAERLDSLFKADVYKLIYDIEQVTGKREALSLLCQICKTLLYYFEIDGCNSAVFLEKRLDLLNVSIKTSLICQDTPKEKLQTVRERGRGDFNSCTKIIRGVDFTSLYKQRGGCFMECAMWDIACILEVDSYVAPSCPVYIHKRMATIQPFVNGYYLNDPLFADKMQASDYWRFILVNALFSHTDSIWGNIGFSPEYNLMVWDNEFIFSEGAEFRVNLHEMPSGRKFSLSIPFLCYPAGWPASNVSLSQLSNNDRGIILDTINLWQERKAAIDQYFAHAFTDIELTQKALMAFEDRRAAILNAFVNYNDISITGILRDVFLFYPLDLDGLVPIIENFYQRSVQPMEALLTMRSRRLDGESQKKIQFWLEKIYYQQQEIDERSRLPDA